MLTLVNHESSEGRILAAAQRVLRREGAGGLTMRAVATEAGLTATAIYRHYQDKAALLKRIIREEYNLFLSYVTAVKPGLGPGDQLRATCDRYVDFAIEHPQSYQLLFVEPHGISIDRYPKDFQTGRSRGFGQLRTLVVACMEAGAIRDGDPTDVALDIYAHLHGLVMLHSAGRFDGRHAVMWTFVRRSIARLL